MPSPMTLPGCGYAWYMSLPGGGYAWSQGIPGVYIEGKKEGAWGSIPG